MGDSFRARLKSYLVVGAIVLITLGLPQLFWLHKICFALATALTAAEISLAFYSSARVRSIHDPDNVGETVFLGALIICGGGIAYLTLNRWQSIVVLLNCVVCDTLAYCVGKLLGQKFFCQRKPFPNISPGKTYEGTIGGILCTALVLGLIYRWTGHTLRFFELLLLITGGVLCVTGDLLGSLIKRKLGLKDSGEIAREVRLLSGPERIMSGFGGYLDRLDSVCFTSFVVAALSSIFSHQPP